MHIRAIVLSLVLLAATGRAAERRFDFSNQPLDKAPEGCISTVVGQGKPGTWKVIMDEVPLAMQSLSTNSPAIAKKAVIAQTAEEFTDEHFPMLLLSDDVYGDFTFTARFKTVSGVLEQMAGIAFRVQDEKNYYAVRASSLGNNFRFYKVVNGQRGNPIGPDIELPKGVWHEVSIECKANQLHFMLDGREIIPMLTDSSFNSGKIGFWTKSDSVSYFADARVVYTPREPFMQGVIRETVSKYPTLAGLRVSALSGKPPQPLVVASLDEKEIGRPGETNVVDVIHNGRVYYGKENSIASITLPLRDRNGEAVAAVRVQMKSFRGQTEESAINRAIPILKHMQLQVAAADDFNVLK